MGRRDDWLSFGATALALVLLVLGGCRGPGGAVEVPPEEIPFELSRSPEATESPVRGQILTVYFVRGERLVALTRVVDQDLPAAEAALRALLEGPTEREVAAGVRSELTGSTRLLRVAVLDHIAEVDLSAEFQSPGLPQDILLRVAQVVWTLVRLPDITAVRFAIEGEPISVLTDQGTPVDRPVTTPDYVSVAPPAAE